MGKLSKRNSLCCLHRLSEKLSPVTRDQCPEKVTIRYGHA